MAVTGIVKDPIYLEHKTGSFHPESTERLKVLYEMLEDQDIAGQVDLISPRKATREEIEMVHDPSYFERVAATEGLPHSSLDPDTQTSEKSYEAALYAAGGLLLGIDRLFDGKNKNVLALVRPPGHHAERKVFGGFCYFNSAAIAANFLSKFGKVAMLDIDYHHGNGQQDIFYHRKDVLTISIHGHPSFAYPYFSGFPDEKGEDEGKGYNINYPLKESISGEAYRMVLRKALERIRRFKPEFLVVPLGLDISKGDPTGTWKLTAADIQINGKEIGSVGIPTLFVQEGGYKNRVLGINARNFFMGFHASFFQTSNKEPLQHEK